MTMNYNLGSIYGFYGKAIILFLIGSIVKNLSTSKYQLFKALYNDNVRHYTMTM
jgi:hypothetical protein